MRDPIVTFHVVSALLLAVSALAVHRRHGSRAALTTSLLQLAFWSLAVLALPPLFERQADRAGRFELVAVASLLVAAALPLALARSAPLTRLAAGISTPPWRANLTLAVMAVLLVPASLEFLIGSLTRAGLVRRYTPTETLVANATEDWRLHHIMGDEFREPDPVLLWRPVARTPYSPQRFRGTAIAPERRPGVVRIFAYGDSNTDGPPEGGAWPEALAEVLAGSEPRRLVEVVNAGVTGYSSYQGRRRLEQEIGIYHPDVVLVSFGWNDAATAISTPDKAFAQSRQFQAASPFWLSLRRVLLSYDTLAVAARLLTRPRALDEADAADVGPRVALDDYGANLRAMIARSRMAGARPILMTRPHRESVNTLAASPGWRARVPDYNDQARRVAESEGVVLVDVQEVFDGRSEDFADESHLTRAGHRRLAEHLRDRLLALGF